jgi:hypothetical protein
LYHAKPLRARTFWIQPSLCTFSCTVKLYFLIVPTETLSIDRAQLAGLVTKWPVGAAVQNIFPMTIWDQKGLAVLVCSYSSLLCNWFCH